MDTNPINISLEELSEAGDLSVRAYNICKWQGFMDVKAILIHRIEYGNFLTLRNCGVKSNAELLELCNKYITIVPESKNEKLIETFNPWLDKVNLLNPQQKQILDQKIKLEFLRLSVRSSTALKKHFDSSFGLHEVILILSDPHFSFNDIKNVGVLSVTELKAFFKSVRQLIELSSEAKKMTSVELFSTFLSRKFLLSPSEISEIWNNYPFANIFPIFKTIQLLLEQNFLFNSRYKIIFKKGFNIYTDSTRISLDEIGKFLPVKLTRERIRQLREKIYDNLDNKFSFLSEPEFETQSFYGIDFSEDFIHITNALAEKINQIESTHFNKHFITKILHVLCRDKYAIIGNEKNIFLFKNRSKVYNWTSTYLVVSEYVNIFDFESFAKDLNTRLQQKKLNDVGLTFEDYIKSFYKRKRFESFNNISRLTEYLLLSEFNLKLDDSKYLILKRSIPKKISDYVCEILEDRRKPLHIKLLFKIISENHPGMVKNETSLRSNCLRDANLISFGRSSTYGLKKWEKELNIKGGTIRNMVVEFLTKHKKPKHINEITEYVNKYRNTNSKNIMNNLKIDKRNEFVFYEGLYVGLEVRSFIDPSYAFKYTKRKYASKQIKNKHW